MDGKFHNNNKKTLVFAWPENSTERSPTHLFSIGLDVCESKSQKFKVKSL